MLLLITGRGYLLAVLRCPTQAGHNYFEHDKLLVVQDIFSGVWGREHIYLSMSVVVNAFALLQ